MRSSITFHATVCNHIIVADWRIL